MPDKPHFTPRETVILPLAHLENNTGQLPGLPANPRRIDPDKYQRLKQSLTDHPEYLQANPLKVYPLPDKADRYIIIGGNMRRRALKDLGYKDVPCFVLPTDTPAEDLRAYIIIDNNNYGEWNIEALRADFTLEELDTYGIELPEIEIPEEEREPQEDDFTEDDIEEAPTRTHSGDLWLMGPHRLLVGDSTRRDDIQRLTEGRPVDLLLTDPPYNVDYTGGTKDKMKIANDKMSDAAFSAFLLAFLRAAAEAMKPGAPFYVWHADHKVVQVREALQKAGLNYSQTIIWYKSQFVIGHLDHQMIHEPCLYGWKLGATHYFKHDRSQQTVYDATTDYRHMSKPQLIRAISELTRHTTFPTAADFQAFREGAQRHITETLQWGWSEKAAYSIPSNASSTDPSTILA